MFEVSTCDDIRELSRQLIIRSCMNQPYLRSGCSGVRLILGTRGLPASFQANQSSSPDQPREVRGGTTSPIETRSLLRPISSISRWSKLTRRNSLSFLRMTHINPVMPKSSLYCGHAQKYINRKFASRLSSLRRLIG